MKTLFDAAGYFLKRNKVVNNTKSELKIEKPQGLVFSDDANITIRVANIKSPDAFDFSFFNNNLLIEINSTHPLYELIYIRLSEEQKALFDFFISSICQMSIDTTNSKVQQLDRKFCRRWGEYLEEKLMSMNFE